MHTRDQIQTLLGAAFLTAAALFLYNPAMALQSSGYTLTPLPITMQTPNAALPQGTEQPSDSAQQPRQEEVKSVVIVGVISKSGSEFILRDSNGNIYQLDAPDKAAPYDGKYVKVTGTLQENAKLLHVDTIEEVDS